MYVHPILGLMRPPRVVSFLPVMIYYADMVFVELSLYQ